MKDSSVDPIIRDFVRKHPDITVDRYTPKGGFGQLYFGQRNILGDRVALKFYKLDPGGSSHDEPRLLKEINHDNILPIYDARIIDKDIAYYLTPEISGGDLQSVVDNSDLTTDQVIGYIQDVLKGLNELHKSPRNLVHRDLKPGNILVDTHNTKAYLADFGSIKKIPDGLDNVTASTFTFLYRPPEVINLGIFYKQSDIYQMGIILYQALRGGFYLKNPEMWIKGKALLKFNKLDHAGKRAFLPNYLENLIKTGKLLDLNTLPDFVNKKLRHIIKTATHPDFSKRYQTCAEFLKALFDYQGTSKNWWIESKMIHAFCKKRQIRYRIGLRGSELVVESGKNSSLRKRTSNNDLKKLIKFIEDD